MHLRRRPRRPAAPAKSKPPVVSGSGQPHVRRTAVKHKPIPPPGPRPDVPSRPPTRRVVLTAIATLRLHAGLNGSICSVREDSAEAQDLEGLSHSQLSPCGLSRTVKNALPEARGCEGRRGTTEARSGRGQRVMSGNREPRIGDMMGPSRRRSTFIGPARSGHIALGVPIW
jgi:hypothetical protein